MKGQPENAAWCFLIELVPIPSDTAKQSIASPSAMINISQNPMRYLELVKSNFYKSCY